MKEIKEMLINYLSDKTSIKTFILDIKRLEIEEIGVGGSNFEINGDIRPKGYMSSSIENKIISNADKIKLLESKIKILQAKLEMIDSLINTQKEFDRQIIKDYYINKIGKEAIIKNCNMEDEKSLYRKINSVIKKMQINYDKIRT